MAAHVLRFIIRRFRDPAVSCRVGVADELALLYAM